MQGNILTDEIEEGQFGDNNVILKMEELQRIFDIFHSEPQQFADSEIQEEEGSAIPHMSSNSMFFTCYTDDIYDVRTYYNGRLSWRI